MLVFFLFINSGGFIIIFYQVQSSVKTRMLSSIREGKYKIDQVVKLKLGKDKLYVNTDRITWKGENEFEYNGMLYDIIKIETDHNDVNLYCLSDLTEARIVRIFYYEVNDLASGKMNSSKYKTSLQNLISQALCLSPYKLIYPEDIQEYSSETFLHIPYSNIDIVSPPPKSA